MWEISAASGAARSGLLGPGFFWQISGAHKEGHYAWRAGQQGDGCLWRRRARGREDLQGCLPGAAGTGGHTLHVPLPCQPRDFHLPHVLPTPPGSWDFELGLEAWVGLGCSEAGAQTDSGVEVGTSLLLLRECGFCILGDDRGLRNPPSR